MDAETLKREFMLSNWDFSNATYSVFVKWYFRSPFENVFGRN